MNISFSFKDIKVGDKANIGEVSVRVQYQPGELKGEYELFRQVLKEAPEIVADLGTGAIAFAEVDKAFIEGSKSENSLIDIVKSAINKIRETA